MDVKANGICNECDEPARVIVFSGGADEYSHGVCEDCLALAAKRLDNGMNCGEVKSAAPVGTARRCAIYDAACLTPMACGETGACLAGAPAGTAPTTYGDDEVGGLDAKK